MTGERPVAVPPAAAARARALPEGAAPAGPRRSGPRPPGPRRPEPGPDPSDADLPETGPPASRPSGPGAGVGPAEARALIRTQLRIALGTCAIVMAVVTGLPVLLAAVPEIARARVHGVPLWWLVLALGVQPLWIAVSQWQLRRAERAERDLTGPVGRP